MGHTSMHAKRTKMIAIMVFATLEAACIIMATGWVRQLDMAGLIRAERSMQKRVSLPPGYTVALPSWPAQFQRVTLAEAVSGWHKYTAGRRVSIFNHTVFLPQAIRKLALWGHIRPGGSLTLSLNFHGDHRYGAFQIPIQVQRVDLGTAAADSGAPLAPRGTPATARWTMPTTYGKPAPGDLIISWMHHIRMPTAANARMAGISVKSFRLYLPPWAKTIRLSWKKATDQAPPRLGYTASSLGRHLIISASWDWSNHGNVTVKRYASNVFAKARQTLRRAGCAPWLLSHAVRHGLALLRGVSPEDILRMSLGIYPRYWKPRTGAELRIAMAVAASVRIAGLDSHSVGTLYYLPLAAGSFYYSVRPEIHFKGKAVVAGQSFYLFGPSGDLRVGGYIVTAKNISSYRGIGLAAGSLNFLPRSDRTGIAPPSAAR